MKFNDAILKLKKDREGENCEAHVIAPEGILYNIIVDLDNTVRKIQVSQ